MGIIAVILLLLLLWFPSLSLRGASAGLLLWFQVVLPTLSPFLICTQAITALNGFERLLKPFYPFFHRFFDLSIPGAYVLLCGMLCGYPVGASLCADFLEQEKISQQEADHLLAICSHPSPMFLLGYVRGQLTFPVSPALILCSMYLPMLPISILARTCCKSRRKTGSFATCSIQPGAKNSPTADQKPTETFSMEEIISSSAEIMVFIGGSIMIFSILAAWIDALPGLSPVIKAILIGAAEMTTGIHRMAAVLPSSFCLPAILAAAAFSGGSGILQVHSVLQSKRRKLPGNTKNAGGLSIRHFVLWKTLHALLTCITAAVLLNLLPNW